MKLTVILSLVFISQAFAVQTYSQATTLSFEMRSATVREVLDEIESGTEFYFLYSSNVVNVDRVVDITCKNQTIQTVLDDLFDDSDVRFDVYDRQIVLSKKSAEEASAQSEFDVSGVVKNTMGEPMPGVTVVLKGTSKGVITNNDGSYTLTDVPENGTLVFSFIGMRTQEVDISSNARINVTMKEDIIGLDEIVAVGYGVQKKSDVTGAMVSVSSEDLTEQPANNALEAMQGKAAGVDIITSQRPGEIGSIRIRGSRSLNASNDPLYVVDGVPLMSSSGIETINPQDIKSIDILKDASATAIYGSRGANGVVLVTTKRGTAGEMTITYSGKASLEQMVWRSEYMDVAQYVDFVRWGSYNKNPDLFLPGNQPSLENDELIELFSSEAVAWNNIQKGWSNGTWDPSKIETFDWLGEVTQPNLTQEHTLSASGGTEKMNTYISIGYLDNQGTIKGQEYKRYSVRASSDLKLRDWLRVGASINATMSMQEYGQSNIGTSMRQADNLVFTAAKIYPYALPYDEAGNIIPFPGGQSRVSTVIDEWKYSTNERDMKRILGSFYAEVDLIDGLTYRVNLGPDYRSYRNGIYNDGESVTRGGSSYAEYSGNYNFSWTLDNMLNYDKTFGDHTLGATLLQTASKWTYESYDMSAQNLPTSEQKWYNMGSVAALDSWGTDLTERQLSSYMARVNYNYKQKYLLTMSARWDGASQLADGNKWAFFPSVALGWRMEQEEFIKDIEWIDQMKLRLGYGMTGNSAVSPYTTKGQINQIMVPFGSSIHTGYTTTNDVSNLDLGWEKTTQYNLGIDFSLYNGRVNGMLDIYTSNTSDLIMTMSLPTVSGYNSTLANVGKTKNNGFDLTLNTINIKTHNFSWATTINAAWQKNEIVELMNGKEDMVDNQWFIGRSINVVYDYERLGLWQDTPEDQAEMAKFNANGHNFQPGNVKVKDQNGDYSIKGNDDRIVIGNEQPRWIVGLGNTFSYKDWELSIFINGRLKYLRGIGEGLTGMYGDQRVLDYWTPDNTDAEYQKPYRDEAGGDSYAMTYYKDDSYLKIRNISLGYNVPKAFISRLGVENLKVFVQTKNPGMLWSNIDFHDAEYNSIYYNRGFVFGVNVGF
jgi:TonB-linked SusC/RagA family outer membrane protein